MKVICSGNKITGLAEIVCLIMTLNDVVSADESYRFVIRQDVCLSSYA